MTISEKMAIPGQIKKSSTAELEIHELGYVGGGYIPRSHYCTEYVNIGPAGPIFIKVCETDLPYLPQSPFDGGGDFYVSAGGGYA